MTPKGRPQEVFLIPRAHSTEKVFSVRAGQCPVYSVRRMAKTPSSRQLLGALRQTWADHSAYLDRLLHGYSTHALRLISAARGQSPSDAKEKQISCAIVLCTYPLEIEVCERECAQRTPSALSTQASPNQRRHSVDLTTKSAKKLVVETPATVGLGLCSQHCVGIERVEVGQACQ